MNISAFSVFMPIELSKLGFALSLSGLIACGGAVPGEAVQQHPERVSPALSCTQGPMVAGIDVSHVNGAMNWAQVRSAGFAFAYAKASEGITYKDPEFATNWAQMKTEGVVRGAYHFFHPDDDGTAQADAYLAQVGTFEPGDLPPMLDWEVDDCATGQECASDDAGKTGCYSIATQTQSALDFIAEIKAVTGLDTTVYTYPSFFNCMDNPAWTAAYPLYQATYPSSAVTSGPLPPSGICPAVIAPWETWTLWQWSATGSIAGASGSFDFDVFNGTLADLQAFTVQDTSVGSGGGSGGGTAGGSGGGSGGSTGGGVQCPSGYTDDNGACVPDMTSSGCDVSGQRGNVLFGFAALLVLFVELRRARSRRAL